MHVYLEGGRQLRNPMKAFLRRAVMAIHHQSISLDVEPCGSRDDAIRRCAREGDSLLLIDSEGEELQQLTTRVTAQIGSTNRAFFMVQLMEAWFVADRQNLAAYFGAGFRHGALPANASVEEVSKQDIETGLRNATRNCAKRRYLKGRDDVGLLNLLDPAAVYDACPNFASLIDFLRGQPAT